MNAASVSDRIWRRRHWWAGFILLLLVQWLLLAQFSGPERSSPAPRQGAWQFGLIVDEELDPRFSEMLAVRDPTLFALVHPRGFSGSAWLNFRSQAYRSSDWVDAAEWWLKPEIEGWGSDFAQYVQTNASPGLWDYKPAPRLGQLAVNRPLLGAQSRLRIEGPLGGQAVKFLPSLPSIRHTEYLTNSVVQVMVTPAGQVLSKRLVQSSGLSSADEMALELSQKARFAPLPVSQGRGLIFGQLIFEWHTEEATNAPPGQTQG